MLAACDDPPASEPEAPTTEPAPPPTAPPDPEPEADPEAVDQPLDLDEMPRDELEAACFEGSQAACDRLGH